MIFYLHAQLRKNGISLKSITSGWRAGIVLVPQSLAFDRESRIIHMFILYLVEVFTLSYITFLCNLSQLTGRSPVVECPPVNHHGQTWNPPRQDCYYCTLHRHRWTENRPRIIAIIPVELRRGVDCFFGDTTGSPESRIVNILSSRISDWYDETTILYSSGNRSEELIGKDQVFFPSGPCLTVTLPADPLVLIPLILLVWFNGDISIRSSLPGMIFVVPVMMKDSPVRWSVTGSREISAVTGIEPTATAGWQTRSKKTQRSKTI